ncbi:Flp pilus assembly protein TadG [Arthrobacter agilis]|uniref:TadE/TadG family type IV pilus assembly protein n=1 Tax=Arthrobacter agilis TaxID=37921 RepID=UPI000B573F30|nr:TadE family protein [Arthrobacter agilis]OUM41529.1 pilus assembly protein TadE [Arthrobacter agilis]VDR32981.1 Flp pilus assembly protein TadG [Arthrobacter agilis]
MASKMHERGAVAVELALVLPILILLMFGIIEVGRAYNAQVTLTSAAREGVRVVAIGKNDSAAVNRAIIAAEVLDPDLSPSNFTIVRSAGGAVNTCAATSTVTMTITYTMTTLTGIAAPFSLRGKGVMLCGG